VLPNARLLAVGSRSLDKAVAFADQHQAERRYGSYEALVADPDVDIVYVATPHPFHHDHSLLAIAAGKAVLCEKPFAVNAAQAAAVIAASRAKGVFCMEAMWTRFLPAMVRVREWLAAGRIGAPRLLTADFGFRAGWNPDSRLLSPALAGGALLDVGVYVTALSAMVFGPRPTRVTGFATLGETGVDEQAAFVLGYGGGGLASLTCAVRTNTPQEARIDGEAGRISLDGFWHAEKAVLHAEGHGTETVELPLRGGGFEFEAAEAMRCLEAGLTESPDLPLDETLAIAETMDALRAQWGLRYPME
jgi:predicted dehydrogenase